MTDELERHVREDRMLRDAARALLEADVANLKASLHGRSIPSRIVDRISEGATDALDEAADLAEKNRGIIAAVVAGIVLWLARNPLLDLVFGEHEQERNADLDR